MQQRNMDLSYATNCKLHSIRNQIYLNDISKFNYSAPSFSLPSSKIQHVPINGNIPDGVAMSSGLVPSLAVAALSECEVTGSKDGARLADWFWVIDANDLPNSVVALFLPLPAYIYIYIYIIITSIYTVSQKNDNHVAHYNFNAH